MMNVSQTSNTSGGPLSTCRIPLSFIAFAFAATVATYANAADECQVIKASLQEHGSYVQHYRDPNHSNLDLYKRYVNSSLSCNGDEELETAMVPNDPNCQVSECGQSYGRQHG